MPRTNDEIRRDVIDNVPRFYDDFPEVIEILSSDAEEAVSANEETKDLLDQFFINRATWGVDYWEKAFDIENDGSRTLEERRAVIRGRIRGAGITTLSLIRNTAEAYDGGEVDVEMDAENYLVTVTFIGTRGIPSNLQDTENALREIIPAHLGVEFEFTYLTYDELAQSGITYDDLLAENLTYEELKTTHFN